MKIAYRVQHAAGRDAALQRLLARLPPEAEVITDYETSNPIPWRGYLACLQGVPPDATHLCVMQDDALPCKDFSERVAKAINERPDDVLALFVGGLSGRTRKLFWEAQKLGDRFSPIYFREIHHVVALVWPAPLVEEFLSWYELNQKKIPGHKPPQSDDAVIGYWARTTRRLFYATVPCLVEHPDDLPSVVQNAGRPLGDAGRKAIAFIDDI